jgi:hypothetical protein
VSLAHPLQPKSVNDLLKPPGELDNVVCVLGLQIEAQ